MAFSKTEICNLALGRIGAQTIMDIDENDKNARACKNALELVVKEASRAGEWHCLKKRVELARDAVAPAFGWDYAYTLPSDWLGMVQLNGVDFDGDVEDVYEIESGKILTDADEAKIIYVAYVPDPAKWDALFTSAVVALLASRIAITLRQDEGLSQMLASEFERISLPKAGVRNHNESKRRRFDPMSESRVLASRYYSTNG